MFGKNKILKPSFGDGDELAVVEIFPTIQGEGPFAGESATFIRLGGCNLTCDFCDTEFDSFESQPLQKILNEVVALSKNSENKIVRKLVVITGGEPLRQPISKLCSELIKFGFKVQIETNGTIFRELPSEVFIVCSPKNTGAGYFKIREDLLSKIHALKFIISASNKKYDHLPEVGQNQFSIPVYLQPMDEYDAQKNAANLELAKNLAIGSGSKLSLQIHKIIGVR